MIGALKEQVQRRGMTACPDLSHPRGVPLGREGRREGRGRVRHEHRGGERGRNPGTESGRRYLSSLSRHIPSGHTFPESPYSFPQLPPSLPPSLPPHRFSRQARVSWLPCRSQTQHPAVLAVVPPLPAPPPPPSPSPPPPAAAACCATERGRGAAHGGRGRAGAGAGCRP